MGYKLSFFTFFLTLSVHAQVRQEVNLEQAWQFSHDKQSWKTVSIPHDWAIDGPFDKKWDLQVVRIEQNGEQQATEKSGRSGALPWIGEGHYKRTFVIPDGFKGHAELVFDGAMSEPTVTVNGRYAGYWAYGYNSFRLDITSLVHPGDNQLEVDLKNVEESSRWYPGAGIYRPVTLVLAPQSHLDRWATFIRTTAIENGEAQLAVTTSAAGSANAVEVVLQDANGHTVDQHHAPLQADGTVDLTLCVNRPHL